MTSRSKPPDDPRAEAAPPSEWTKSGLRETPLNSGRSSQPAAEGGGFTPGTMLAGRYRVVALLGRGGMGEVYRAEDTKLGQAVALKFVRGDLSPEVLERLYSEVRIGRQIAHPNVCRLYDIVEQEGHTFLAMEYVDGEDLSSLLTRIGHLPANKALDVARDLCAGLAAMHDRGIVHRDLKPANVMIDGRGSARLTDFGLAVATQAPGASVMAGTPAYMAPEQLRGGEVTSRSDLYSLGLLLFEMATGRRFFESRTLDELIAQHAETKTPRLSSAARLLDPHLERLIRECLEEQPSARPASARHLLAILPGGDPLEAALLAGETPSPEVVASAGKVGDLAPATAWACLLGVVVALGLAAVVNDRTLLHRTTPPPKAPSVLVERAREILKKTGAPAPVDAAYGYEWDEGRFDYVRHHDPTIDRWDRLRRSALPPLLFRYRESPRPLVAFNRDSVVRSNDPPMSVPGMGEATLDSQGRLMRFVAVPAQTDASGVPGAAPDWNVLLKETAFDPAALQAVAPEWTAPVDSDTKAAWEGAFPGEPGLRCRIEAAGYRGRPVFLAVITPWAVPVTTSARGRSPVNAPVGTLGLWVLALALPTGGVLLARRNLRLGRGDRKGAYRIALFTFVVYTIARLFRADHVSSGLELWIVIGALAYPMFWAALVWLLYLALEPFARRRWPHVLISWKRALAGQLRDPLVGRDVLVGATVGSLVGVSYLALSLVPAWFGRVTLTPGHRVDAAILSALHVSVFRLFVNEFSAVLFAMIFLFMLVLIRMLVRNTALSMLLWCLLIAPPFQGEDPLVEWWAGAWRAVIYLLLLTRGGLLCLAVGLFYLFVMVEFPLTLDLGAFHATSALPGALALLGLAVYGFFTALAGKPVFGRVMLDD